MLIDAEDLDFVRTQFPQVEGWCLTETAYITCRLFPCPPDKVPMDICGSGNLQVDERFHKAPNQAVTGLVNCQGTAGLSREEVCPR
jgi:hypothetical protein